MTLKDILIAGKLTISEGGGGGGGLPSYYTRYDYLTPALEFDKQGNKHIIHTPAQIKTDYTIEAKLYLPDLGTQFTMTPIMGTRGGNSGAKEFALFYRAHNTDGRLGYWYDGTDTTTVINFRKNTYYTLKIKPVGASEEYPENVTIDLNETEYNTGSSSTGKSFDPWFGIFGYAISATGVMTNDVVYQGIQVGDILVTDSNGVPVYNFVPVKSANGKYGYYELVESTFYYNATYATDGYVGGYWS